jgi:hypothetical protein
MSCNVARKQKLLLCQDSRMENGDLAYVREELCIGKEKSLFLCAFLGLPFIFTVVTAHA